MAITESIRPTVEQRGRETAVKRQQKLLSREGPNYRYIQSQHIYALDFPQLTSGDPELAIWQPFQDDLRFNPIVGEIYSTIWRDMKTEKLDPPDPQVPGLRKIIVPKTKKNNRTGIRYENFPENYVSLQTELPDGTMSAVADPERIPAHGDVKMLVINRIWDGLETAIRQPYHVLKNYDPSRPLSETQILRSMLYWLDNASASLREENVDKSDLERISIEAAKIIGKAGLTNAIDEKKQNIAQMLTKASNIDSMGRVNPLIARTRLSSARINALERILIGELIHSKFSSNLAVLLAERSVTRDAMTQASVDLKIMQEQLGDPHVTDADRKVMARRVNAISKNELRVPRVAPYLIPSRIASVFLAGSTGQQRDADAEILGEEFANDVFRRRTGDEPFYKVNYLLANGFRDEANRQITWVTSLLDDALLEFENIFPPEEQTEVEKNVIQDILQ